jgi:hypothetical protein
MQSIEQYPVSWDCDEGDICARSNVVPSLRGYLLTISTLDKPNPSLLRGCTASANTNTNCAFGSCSRCAINHTRLDMAPMHCRGAISRYSLHESAYTGRYGRYRSISTSFETLSCPCCMTHSQAKPGTVQKSRSYNNKSLRTFWLKDCRVHVEYR